MHSITKAARLLNISEYELFDEAYLHMFGDHADAHDIVDLLSRFTMFGAVPDWADQFARNLLGDLEANRAVTLKSFSAGSLTPRVGSKPELTFTLMR